MSDAETEKQRSSVWRKTKLIVCIVVLLFAAVYVPARLLAVRYTNRGTELYNESKFDEAIAQFERAMRTYPGFKPARKMLGQTCHQKAESAFAENDYTEAEKQYKRAIKLKAETSDVHYKLAHIYWVQGKNARGLAELDKHAKQKPKDRRVEKLRGLLQREKKANPPAEDEPSPENEPE